MARGLSRKRTPLMCCLLMGWFGLGWQASESWAEEPFLVVLGIAQDGGCPHAGCQKTCCEVAWQDVRRRHFVSCVAVVDPESKQRWLFDCTPDFPDQLRLLDQMAPRDGQVLLDGILLTHAHIGHYAGLMHLGREVMGARRVPTYAMPRMKSFLEDNGPWSQLVDLEQIKIRPMTAGQTFSLNERIRVTPILVPHRDEFSETVAFRIEGPNRSALYLPDIDQWGEWDVNVESAIEEVDMAFLDGTFMSAEELPGRDLSEIPHPLITQSIERFGKLPLSERRKVRFIHLNHSNPALDPQSPQRATIRQHGMRVAEQGDHFEL